MMSGVPGVVMLVIVAGIYDVLAVTRGWETISTGVRRVLRHPSWRLAAGALAGALVMHITD